MTKEKRLKEIIQTLRYNVGVGEFTAATHAVFFENIADRWHRSEMKKLKKFGIKFKK